jgi:lysyl-tRNA synthetase class 2
LRDDDWRPSASTQTLVARAQTLTGIRAFFAQRDVLEVDTPILSRTTVTEPAIDSLALGDGAERRYLQTSPEYHMKRMLAAGAPSIVRIGPVFRAEESGRLHNPEFTMIEWYRRGFDLAQLIDEVAALVDLVLGAAIAHRVTYRQLLVEGAGIDPLRNTDAELFDALKRCGVELSANADVTRRDLLDLLANHAIEAMGSGRVFITDYPADQAALARVTTDANGFDVAQRFELVIDGVEIANGYDELLDARVLERRMHEDIAVRARAGRKTPAPDERLLAAMSHGLPRCSGVALGFDRLLMLKLGFERIDAVLPFSFARS